MNNPFIPDVTLPASDHRRLERLAQVGADQGDVDARFLLSEINRAKIVPDRAARLDNIVTMGSWVTFWINLGGSLVLGVLLEWLLHAGPDRGRRRAVRLGVGTGLIGGFTTYSTFVLETVGLAQDGRVVVGVAYALVSIVLGVVAAGAGTGLVVTSRRWIARRRGEES